MNRIFKFLLSTVFCISLLNGHAQFTHNTKDGSQCKYAKNRCKGSEGCLGCVACAEIAKKETLAKEIENKRREDAAIAKFEADKQAKELAIKMKQQEKANKPETGQVLINGNNRSNTIDNSIKKPKIVKSNVEYKGILYGSGRVDSYKYNSGGYLLPHGYLKTEHGEVVLSNSNWTCAYAAKEVSFLDDCILSNSVVRFGDPQFTYKDFTFHNALINLKGEIILEEKNIRDISYLNDGWYLIGTFDSKDFLFNPLSNKRIILEDLSPRGRSNGYDRYGPIFSSKFVLNSSYRNEAKELVSHTKANKRVLTKLYPTYATEEFLNNYSFVLVHTDYYRPFYYIENEARKIKLYCVKKDGNLTTITLK